MPLARWPHGTRPSVVFDADGRDIHASGHDLIDDVLKGSKVSLPTCSLRDFARIVDVRDKHGVSFVSVTEQFNTTRAAGRLTAKILRSFAQFEREIIAERTSDKLSAARRKGR